MAFSAANRAEHSSASLYVGDLAEDVTEATLFEIFNAVGPCSNIRVVRDSLTRRSLKYAFVNYQNPQDAERALDTMNFINIRGKPCRIMWCQCDPTLRKSGVGNIFVKNLDKSIDNKTLYDTFSMFGNIHSCKVATDKDGNNMGYGFVHYTNPLSAETAIKKVHGMVIAEKKVEVAPFKKKETRLIEAEKDFQNIYLKQFPLDTTEEELKALLQPFGEILSFHAPKNATGQLVGFAFCNFKTHESAAKAVEELNNKTWKTQVLYCSRHKKKMERFKQKEASIQKLRSHSMDKRINLFVKNLSSTVTEARLRILFSPYGNIFSCSIKTDPMGNSKGFGFVCFEKPEQASRALANLNGQIIDGKSIYIAIFQPKSVREAYLRTKFAQNPHHTLGPVSALPQMNMNNFPMYENYSRPPMSRKNFGGYPNAMNYQAPVMAPRNMHQLQNQQRQQHQLQNQQRQQYPNSNIPIEPSPPFQPMRTSHIPPSKSLNYKPTTMTNAPYMNFPIQKLNNTNNGPNLRTMAAPPPPPKIQSQLRTQPPQALTFTQLPNLNSSQQKQVIGEKIFPQIKSLQPRLAGKITGMLLEMDNAELLNLLENHTELIIKANEAVNILNSSKQTPNIHESKEMIYE